MTPMMTPTEQRPQEQQRRVRAGRRAVPRPRERRSVPEPQGGLKLRLPRRNKMWLPPEVKER